MKKKILVALLFVWILSCNKETPTQFSDAALQEQLVTVHGETITFESILEKHKGKTILITIWATWCRDCNEELPRIKAVQGEKNEVVYVFLSLDRTLEKWKKGISKFEIKGDHYFMPAGWNGPFVDFIDLDWITRYMVVDAQGTIKLFKAIKINNKHLRESLTN
jgi:thiol-disulfide isomerase/thioredoxin